MDEVKNFQRTNLTNVTANYWEYYGGRANFEYWNSQAGKKLFEYGLDANPPRAARVYALLHIAHYDATIACWDAKYAYWDARPAMLDPTITTIFATPNHPSYPSSHGCQSSAPAGGAVGALPARGGPVRRHRRRGQHVAHRGAASTSAAIRSAAEAIGRQVADLVMARAGSA